MFDDLPQNLILLVLAAFLLGWLLSYVSSRLGAKYRAMKRDSRDDRIRALEAELRVARTDSEYSRGDCAKLEEQLKETTVGLERRDNVITEQMEKLEVMSKDLKDSVIKTRELRTELADRATECLQTEAKVREVQTELSVAQAASDMLSTGVLDYDAQDSGDDDERAEVSEAAN